MPGLGVAIARLASQPYMYNIRHKVIQSIQLDGLKITESSLLFNGFKFV